MTYLKRFAKKEICGAVHLHTTYSDGGIAYPTLIQAAKRAGLDFIIVTDHMSLGGQTDGFEGVSNGVIVIAGYEHQDANNLNHYLAIGISKVFDTLTKPAEYVSAVRNAGGIGFIAHPVEKRKYMDLFPPYPWTDWEVTNFDGIEIWNQMSEWVEQLKKWYSIVKLLYPRRFLDEAPADCLKKWDELNQIRYVSGIGGVDAHTRRIGKGLFSFEVFPIRVELKGIRTHLYLPENVNFLDYREVRDQMITALRDGHSFISNYRRGDATGTVIALESKDGNVYPPGKLSKVEVPATISVNIPQKAEVRLIYDGQCAEKQNDSRARFTINKNGVYRVEVFKKNKAWIYSNPFPVNITYPTSTLE